MLRAGVVQLDSGILYIIKYVLYSYTVCSSNTCGISIIVSSQLLGFRDDTELYKLYVSMEAIGISVSRKTHGFDI